MSKFKPTVSVSKGKDITFPTYRELKKSLYDIIRNQPIGASGEVTVTRSRRGEWGEWYEVWCLQYRKGKLRPKKLREGWM